MSNGILLRQNEDLQLRRLAAQRRLYSRAKHFLAWQMVTTVALVVIWSVLVLWNRRLEVWAALYGVAAMVIDFAVLTPLQHSLKEKAAGFQEAFDCYVLALPWQEIKAGPEPNVETLTEWSQLPSRTDFDTLKLRNWYPLEADALPIQIGRIVCQRANCWWDSCLRRRYANWIVASISLIFVLTAAIALIGKVGLEGFLLAGLTPFLPVFFTGVRQWSEQRQAATRLDDLREHSERLWIVAISSQVTDEEVTRRSRTLQDEIFEQRRRNPLIFDRVYAGLRDNQEDLMNKVASELFAEAQAALNDAHRTSGALER